MLKKTKNKKAVSLIKFYVILISIVIGLSVGVYAWLKVIANPSAPTDCKSDTSVILESQECNPGSLELNLVNNGRFNVNGVIVAVGDDSDSYPTIYLKTNVYSEAGEYFFINPLKPQNSLEIEFTNEDSEGTIRNSIGVIQIQPFIIEQNQKIVCQNSVIKQEVSGCNL